jgi:hypothetical protein
MSCFSSLINNTSRVHYPCPQPKARLSIKNYIKNYTSLLFQTKTKPHYFSPRTEFRDQFYKVNTQISSTATLLRLLTQINTSIPFSAMILSSIVVFAGFICLAHAFVVPQNTGDGVHGADIDQRGASFLEDSSVLVRSATNIITNTLEIRDGSTYTQPADRIHCDCGFNLDQTNYNLAVKDMQTTLRNNNAAELFPANTTSIQGNVIAFVCKGGD